VAKPVNDNLDDYLLTEERPSEPLSFAGMTHQQRILPHDQLIMDAVAMWNGVVHRFTVVKKGVVS
jgi:hypothetical protein